MPIKVCVPKGSEGYDAVNNEFFYVEKDVHITLEHSLISIQKWEQKWHQPFLVKMPKKTNEQLLDYVRCMIISQDVDDKVLRVIPAQEMQRIYAYIEDPMTATTIKEIPGKKGRQQIKTAEVLYSDMIKLGIPFECRKWHLNSLIMLIRVCNEEQAPKKKNSKSQTYQYYSELNKARRKQWNTKPINNCG